MDFDAQPNTAAEQKHDLSLSPAGLESQPSPDSLPPQPENPYRGLRWIFFGAEGLRGGWSILIFIAMFLLIAIAEGLLLAKIVPGFKNRSAITPSLMFLRELAAFIALLGAMAAMARIERRRLMDYNLTGPRRLSRFFAGVVTGFAALSLLVGLLAWGRWLHIGGMALSGVDIARYALVWAAVFLLVGCYEEGSARCYLQFTLTRSINFWWALALVAAMCGDTFLRSKGNGVWGVYALALLGLVPCLLLHLRSVAGSAFWQAAWVTSTLFGFLHITNNGENWIGIFSAGAIGFVFCVSIYVTGSAWWAIGCHAGWDWAETYFYGTADSGVVAPGHLLNSTAAGNPFWSGGADGPEGSILILAVLVALLAWLLIAYGRKSPPVQRLEA
jgi:hypothetical protein